MDVNEAERLIGRFNRMVRRDGGEVSLLGVDGDTVRVGYHPGVDPTCDDASCVLPQAELQELIDETIRRTHPDIDVIVEVTT